MDTRNFWEKLQEDYGEFAVGIFIELERYVEQAALLGSEVEALVLGRGGKTGHLMLLSAFLMAHACADLPDEERANVMHALAQFGVTVHHMMVESGRATDDLLKGLNLN